MSDRAKKSIGQDAVGVLFCLLGGFFLVSIYLNWRGNEPVVALATQPVLELVALLGPVPAALFSLGVAATGAWIFLASLPPVIGRPLGALALGAAALALILGAFAYGGSLGEVFPGLVTGTIGRLIGAVLGCAVLFFAFTLVAPRGAAASAADVMRAGIGGRAELASGVSSAEAALLVSDPRPAARREAPLRDETLRPLAPEKSRTAAPTRPQELAPAPLPAASAAELPRPTAPAWEAGDEADEEPETSASTLASPAREEEVDEDDADETRADEELATELAEALHADEPEEEEEVEEEVEEAAPAALSTPNTAPLSAERPPPSASWEQVSLFDEPEAEEEEPVEAAPAPAATGTLDFGEPARPTHEPELGNADDPFAAEPFVAPAPAAAAPVESEVESEDELAPELAEELAAELVAEADDEEEALEEESAQPEEEPARAVQAPVVAAELPLEPARPVVMPAPARAAAPAPKPAPAPAPEFVLQPKAALRPEPEVAREGDGEWQKLVFDSGLLILEQKRVAVSMLERRFGIDFDSACRVLDELQQAGLIGPYIGGRTREILLTQEQWQAQAAETA